MSELTDLGYAGMFLSAFIAATLLPLGSEIILTTLLLQDYRPDLLLLLATSGNVLGSAVNYYLGYRVSKLQSFEAWHRTQLKQHMALKVVEKYGPVSLLLSWMPIIGDPITFIAGLIRTPLWLFLLLVSVSKFLRYFALFVLTSSLS